MAGVAVQLGAGAWAADGKVAFSLFCTKGKVLVELRLQIRAQQVTHPAEFTTTVTAEMYGCDQSTCGHLLQSSPEAGQEVGLPTGC